VHIGSERADSVNAVLSGVRVIDFGRYVAGPYCAALLADFGADVIRIEKREGSEDRFQLPLTQAQDGAMYMQINRNKRGMTLDPLKPQAREIVRRLVATADVIVANLPAQTLAAMHIDYEALKAVKPDIVLTMVTAYGRGGPYSERVGFDAVAQAMCGATYMTSKGEGEQPYRYFSPWVDFATAIYCAYGTVLALMARQQTGRGQVVEGALLGTALSVSNALLIEQAVTQRNRKPTGNRSQLGAPSDIFKTRDGWVVVAAIGQPLYVRWAKLMGESHWLTDPRFKDDASRAEHGAELCERMARWCAMRSSDEVVETLARAMIPAAPVLGPQQVLDDPHIRALQFLQPTEYPGLPTPAPLARPAVLLSETPGAILHRAPVLGEHTDSILAELRFSEAEIRSFREAGAV